MTNLNNYISIKEVVDGLMVYPSMRDLDYEAAIRWTIDVMGSIGSYDLYKDEVETLEVTNNRAKLPQGIIRIDQIRKISGAAPNVRYEAMDVASDSFAVAYRKYDKEYKDKLQAHKYKQQGDYIYTSFAEGLVEVAYKTLYTDDDGIIMIPVNTSLEKAVRSYIKQEHFRGLFEIKRIDKAIFEEAKQEYCWYIAQAQNSIMNVSFDERQAISNAAHKLMWNDDFHQDGYRDLSNKEYLRLKR